MTQRSLTDQFQSTRVQRVLHTLSLLPDEIFLATMGQEIKPNMQGQCVCGRALAESLARLNNKASDDPAINDLVDDSDVPERLSAIYGGREDEWEDIFYGIMRTDAMVRGRTTHWNIIRITDIEEAIALRLDEIVTPARGS